MTRVVTMERMMMAITAMMMRRSLNQRLTSGTPMTVPRRKKTMTVRNSNPSFSGRVYPLHFLSTSVHIRCQGIE